MTWTTFAPLSAAEMAFLDGNFAALTQMGLVPVDLTGTSVIGLTPTLSGNGPPISAYANYQGFVGVANATNAGAVSAQYTGLTALPVYRDTPSGPVALAGGEIVTLNVCLFVYDSLLNSGAGGFHLVTGGVVAAPIKSTPAGVSATSGVVLSAAFLTGSGGGQGVVVRTGPASGFTDTTDTAAAIAALVPGGGSSVAGTGPVFRCKYVNTTSSTASVAAGSGVVLSGVATVPGPGSADFVGVVVSGGAAVQLFR